MTQNRDFWKRKINVYGLRIDQFLRRLISDYTIHSGFAFKVLYNGVGDIDSIVPIPFETLRLGKADDEGKIKKIAYYKDWSARYIKKDNIRFYDVYNPDKRVIFAQMQNAGGVKQYGGQILYYGYNGELKYPYNSFHPVIEDCVTEIAVKMGKNANVSTNFLASHVLELPFTRNELADQLTTEKEKVDADKAEKKFVESMQVYQGNENTGKIMAVTNTMRDAEGKPIPLKFHKLDVQNFDKINEHTEKTIKDNIRQNYMQPPILNFEVSTGFSTEIFNDAYNYYNEITKYDRQIFEEIFVEMFENWEYDAEVDFEIKKLEGIKNEPAEL